MSASGAASDGPAANVALRECATPHSSRRGSPGGEPRRRGSARHLPERLQKVDLVPAFAEPWSHELAMAAAVVTAALLETTLRTDASDDVDWIGGFAIRGPASLPVALARTGIRGPRAELAST